MKKALIAIGTVIILILIVYGYQTTTPEQKFMGRWIGTAVVPGVSPNRECELNFYREFLIYGNKVDAYQYGMQVSWDWKYDNGKIYLHSPNIGIWGDANIRIDENNTMHADITFGVPVELHKVS